MSERAKLSLFAWQPTFWITIACFWTYTYAHSVIGSHGTAPQLFVVKSLCGLMAYFAWFTFFWKRSPKRVEIQNLPRAEFILSTTAPILIVAIAILALIDFFTAESLR